MNTTSRQQVHIPYLLGLLGVWLAIFLLSFSFVLRSEIRQIETTYKALHEDLTRHIVEKSKTFEVSLWSFATFLASTPDPDLSNARKFVKLLRSYYPDIYMLEIAKRVPHAGRTQLEQVMRSSGYPDFEIHTFSYETDRKPRVSELREAYYPIVFIEPESPEVMGVLGLDLADTSSLLNDALQRSFNQREHVASRPFDLLEGRRGYLLYREVNQALSPARLESSLKHATYALLVVDAGTLIPGWVQQHKHLSVSLDCLHVGHDADSGIVAVQGQEAAVGWWHWLLPELMLESTLESSSQPFVLRTSYEISWQDFNKRSLVHFILTALITFPVALWLSMFLYQRKMHALDERGQLFWQANYDVLTGLPNKNLAAERFQQLAGLLKRHNQKLAMIYIDFDKFKHVNDVYGHAAGDAIIEKSAERLQAALRESDTVARLHGDEFVVLVPDVGSEANARQVIAKLEACFLQPFLIEGQEIELSLSAGLALYPDDGESFDRLLHYSDLKMYEEKRRQRLSVVHHLSRQAD